MPASRTTPESTYLHFFTQEPVTHVARALGVDKKTLKTWWVRKFGLTEYKARVALGVPKKLSREEKKARRRAQDKAWLAKGDNLLKFRVGQKNHRELNKARYQELQQRWYKEHSVEQRAYAQRYREVNKEQMRSKAKEQRRACPETLLYHLAKQRAKRLGLPFDLTSEYIKGIIPELCPITLKPFEIGDGRPVPQSMTLDKIVPAKGYVPGNVLVVSRLANTIKQSCIDPEVFERLADYIETGRV